MPFTEELNIDLASSDRTEMPIKIEWDIQVPEPTGMLKQYFFNKFGKLKKKVHVKITNLKLDKHLEVLDNDTDKLVFLRSEGKCNQQLTFELKELHTYFRVIVDPNKILDCKEREKAYDQRKPYTLSFSVQLSDENDKQIESQDVQVNINLLPVHLNPKVRLVVDERFTYNSNKGLIRIGALHISNPTPKLKFTPGIDVDLKLQISNANQKFPVDAIHIGTEDGTDSYTLDGLLPEDPRCEQIGDRQEMVVPIWIDMHRLRNPMVSSETLTLVALWSYRHSYNKAEYLTGNQAMESILFVQDAQGAELIFNMLDNEQNAERQIHNGDSITLPEISFFAESETVIDNIFRLSNLATDMTRAGAGVRVFGMLITETIADAFLEDRRGNNVDRVFVYNGTAIDELSSQEGITLRNGNNSYKDFSLTFDPGHVMVAYNSRSFHFESVLTVEFDYIENAFGEDYSKLETKHFRVELRQPLFLKPNPKWLCIDYGSSAIVCKYDEVVLNLRTRKETILKKTMPKDLKNLLVDNLEKGTEFLSSDIILHTPANSSANTEVSSLCSERTTRSDINYDKLAVFLSPTSAMIVNEVLRQLPCLKLLVGNEFLPQKIDYQTFSYSIIDPNGGLTTVTAQQAYENNREKSLMVIDNVFRESYEALLKYFIIPEIQDVNLINRLALTYPNTYTPRHLQTLRSIVEKAIPSVRELEFVSESDAVAAYYLENWADYHNDRDNAMKNETILVYDMGAGTLDLSLINKTIDSAGILTMEVVAKIGTCKAGNYLDFVLAEIVCDLIGEEGKGGMALASIERAAEDRIGRERSRLKDFVKNELKPMLKAINGGRRLNFESQNGEHYKSFEIRQVLTDKRFKKFLDDVTKDIVGQLTNFADSKHLQIDTVLMSGRSSLLEPLYDKLRKTIGANAAFIRLDEPVNGINDEARQKVAVTEGAMAIMSRNYRSKNSMRRIVSKRIYASFGVAYKDMGRWYYVELLNYKNIPANLDDEYNGPRVPLKGLANIPKLTVVQSYLNAEATEEALNTNKWDYIAEMERIPLDGIAEQSLMMKVNRDNNVILYIGNNRTRGQAPKCDDLTNEAIKRSVWPVTI